MEYVKVHQGDYGNTLDATDYVDALAEFADCVPSGARAFATEPQHYDFHSQRCVKDLKLLALTVGDSNEVRWAELRLGHNCWKHEEDLTIRYFDVRSLTIDPATAAADTTTLLNVVLDELLPQ